MKSMSDMSTETLAQSVADADEAVSDADKKLDLARASADALRTEMFERCRGGKARLGNGRVWFLASENGSARLESREIASQ